jgi:outer membrane lipoprotein-sorting protein
MRFLRTLSPRRLTAIVAVVAALAATAAVAQAGLIGSDPKPQPKALDRAILDAVNAKPVKGISARIEFTNSLIASGSVPGGGPLLSGAEGRLWTTDDGRFRLELQSERGDAQIASDGKTLTVYDATAKKVYRLALPQKEQPQDEKRATLAGVRKGLDRLAQAWTLSGAKPTSSAGRPSYTLRIAPKDDGGLLGAGKLAWDAVNGVPLRAAVYAQGQSDPVLELKATDVSFGEIDDADLRVTVPSGVEAVDVDPPAGHGAKAAGKHDEDVTGVAAVQKQLGFDLATPAKLAGLPRKEVRLVRFGDQNGALSVYGEGLGGLLVLQREAKSDAGDNGEAGLPQVNIDGATGTELATALGTFVTFEREGVAYTVVGSVPPVAAENAARGLR